MTRRNGQKWKLVGWDKDSLIRQQLSLPSTSNTNDNNNVDNEYAK